ncbi:MAG: NRDE family protein [Rhodospirillales bacterium]
MCTAVILLRSGHDWPVLLAANRDEMAARPWAAPARHWPDRPHAAAGLDILAGGTWMGVNDDGLFACVLNRPGALGPMGGKRSRGELPLEALDHAEAHAAAEALAALEPASYRPFNMLIADVRGAFWLRSDGESVQAAPVPEGLSMLTARDLNDTAASPRMRAWLPRFRAAPAPDPDAGAGAGGWFAWEALLAGKSASGEKGEDMCIDTDESGFGTVSSSLLALRAPGAPRGAPRIIWRFCPGPPGGEAAFAAVTL